MKKRWDLGKWNALWAQLIWISNFQLSRTPCFLHGKTERGTCTKWLLIKLQYCYFVYISFDKLWLFSHLRRIIHQDRWYNPSDILSILVWIQIRYFKFALSHAHSHPMDEPCLQSSMWGYQSITVVEIAYLKSRK